MYTNFWMFSQMAGALNWFSPGGLAVMWLCLFVRFRWNLCGKSVHCIIQWHKTIFAWVVYVARKVYYKMTRTFSAREAQADSRIQKTTLSHGFGHARWLWLAPTLPWSVQPRPDSTRRTPQAKDCEFHHVLELSIIYQISIRKKHWLKDSCFRKNPMYISHRSM